MISNLVQRLKKLDRNDWAHYSTILVMSLVAVAILAAVEILVPLRSKNAAPEYLVTTSPGVISFVDQKTGHEIQVPGASSERLK